MPPARPVHTEARFFPVEHAKIGVSAAVQRYGIVTAAAVTLAGEATYATADALFAGAGVATAGAG